MATVHTREEDDGDIAFILSRRRKRRRSAAVQTWVIAGGVALGAMTAIGLGAIAVNSVRSSRQANWTHTEMVEYLDSQGVAVYRRPVSRGVFYIAPQMQQWSTDYLETFFKTGSETIVFVDLMESEQKAKEAASISERSFSWGRFVFAGKGQLYDQIREALK